MNNQTVLYVNYAPYENSGHILDFLKDHFGKVIVFIFNFHTLGKLQKSSVLYIYEHGKLIENRSLFTLSPSLPVYIVFLLLPIRSLLNTLQIFYHTFWLKRQFGTLEYYFTVNAFTAWVGNVLRKIGLVDTTIFWVWDYYPPKHKDKIVMLMRAIYWQFDMVALASDNVVFLNTRLIELRKRIGALPKDKQYAVIPIGTNPRKTIQNRNTQHPLLSFIGVLKRSQGLDMVFDAAPQLTKKYPDLQLTVIGSGPDESYFQKRAKQTKLITTFHGYVEDEHQVANVLQAQHIGLALYMPDPSNVSYFGDPSKIKDYLSFGVPVITTGVFAFSKEIVHARAGVVIEYGKLEELAKAIQTILSHYQLYSNNALTLAKKYRYNKIYPALFKFLS
ncbi:MAG: glycosyltransferase [Parcubacteria group bacterium]|nr:glycosyltransferase [Parcubacteria group bacterium]